MDVFDGGLMAKRVKHKTGYVVFIAGDQYWHRTYEGALGRVTNSSNWYARDNSQVIEVKTGKMVWGRAG